MPLKGPSKIAFALRDRRAPRVSPLVVLTAVLLVLLPALAVLQYRWVGQVSTAERERMRRNLGDAARQFRDTLDHEIGRAFMSLHVEAALAREQAWDRYAERYAAWAGTSAYPALVADIFLIDAGHVPSKVRLRRWNQQSRQFEPAEWDPPLAIARAHFEAAYEAFTAGQRMEKEDGLDDESLLVAPLLSVQIGLPRAESRGRPTSPGETFHVPVTPTFGFTVLRLNMPFIRDELLPSLTNRHFLHTDGAGYHVAVIDAENPRRVIYRSSPDAPLDEAHADATETLLFPHGNPMMFIARDAAARLPRDTRRHNVVLSMIRKSGEEASLQTRIVEGGAAGRWRLLVRHQSGSLEAAVAGVRQRNLLISFGILLLMAVSMGLLALSSRRAEVLARQQMEFVAGVSHELRTPVAVIRSAAENLSHGVVGDPDRVRRYGDTIQGEARRLGEMVERVLQFAGIESSRAVAQSLVAVEAVIEKAIEAAADPPAEADLPAEAGSHGTRSVASGLPGPSDVEGSRKVVIDRSIAPNLPPVLGDAGALRSAIHNLLINAVKYGGTDRWVGVRVEASPESGPREVRITVEDHGAGIAAADLPHIFAPFYRGADAVARQIQGSGLGLALVQRIVAAHGGHVTVETREGVGSAFTIHLPAAHSKAGVTDATLAPHPSAS